MGAAAKRRTRYRRARRRLRHDIHSRFEVRRIRVELAAGESEGDVVSDDKDESGRNRFREMFGSEKRVSRKLEQMIVVGTPGCVLEIDGITGIRRLDQQVEFSGNTKFT